MLVKRQKIIIQLQQLLSLGLLITDNLRICKRTLKYRTVKMQHCYWKTLKKMRCFANVIGHSRYFLAELAEKGQCLWTNRTKWPCAMGTKKWLVESSPYLDDFLVAANSAALPAHCDDWDTYDWATVSVTVTSQSAHFPAFHGMSVIPSGRFP